jgi:hypothetical protein
MNSDKMAGLLLVLKMLERSAVKVASCVLRGAGRSNVVSLLGQPLNRINALLNTSYGR